MLQFHTVAHVGEIPEGEGRAFKVEGRMIAVFNIEGEYSAIHDTCPHMGASLATGNVEDAAVYCPWHAWRFCVKDGTWLDNPKSELKNETYAVQIVENEIQVAVPNFDPPSDAAESQTD